MTPTQLDHTLKIRLPIILFVVAATAVATYYVSRAERDGVGYAPEQPIAFSHKLHAGTMSIDCQYCHVGAASSPHATIPAAQTCMNCHAVARKNRPEIIKLTKAYEEGTPIPWERVHRVPDYAYFNHSVHVNRGIGCEQCHGQVANMDVLTQVNQFTMAACLDCHRSAPERFAGIPGIRKGPENCAACHR